jgi:hypothetical protein
MTAEPRYPAYNRYVEFWKTEREATLAATGPWRPMPHELRHTPIGYDFPLSLAQVHGQEIAAAGRSPWNPAGGPAGMYPRPAPAVGFTPADLQRLSDALDAATGPAPSDRL